MLYEILKTSKLGASFAPDMYTALWAQKLARDGEVKTLSGAPPLSFQANGTPLLDYLISGNTVQSGTPTPDNPITPQGTGERTGNLLQIADVAETTKNGVTYHVKGNSLYIDGISTVAFGFNIRNAFTLKAGTYTNQMYGFTGKRIYYSFNNVSATMCTSDFNLYKTFTIAEDTTYAKALVWISDGVTFNNEKIDFALFESEVPKDFEPYGVKIPISTVQTTPIYLGEVETTRKIKKLVLTGDENWYVEGSDVFYTDPITEAVRYTPICSHFIGVNTLTGNNQVTISQSLCINIKTTTITHTANDFKTYLAQQYAAGTPVTVWYVLATEETGIVNEPLMKIGDYADSMSRAHTGIDIPTVIGQNTLDVLTTVKPSEIYIKYKS